MKSSTTDADTHPEVDHEMHHDIIELNKDTYFYKFLFLNSIAK